MGGVAGHDDAVRAALFQIPQSAGHLRHRVLPAAQDSGGAVRDVGVAVDVDPDVVPVRLRLGQQDDFFKQVGVARGPMPPKMPMVFFVLLILDTSIL